ncbi:MAG: glycosyltransferase family 87 protein [Actinomycetota bacterium]|jgi:hypothetical protein|nr:glycosyltransferase family 87 protein [Actinomycetota bacterium]
MPRELVRRFAQVVARWSPEERDAVLYAGCALFAVVVAQTSGIALYRQWGDLAVGPYAVGSIASAWLAWRRRRPGAVTAVKGSAESAGARWHWTPSRLLIFLLVLVGATLAPLSLEVWWRNEGVVTSTAHVQPEVEVVEAAGKRVANGQDPYRLLNVHHLPPVPPGQPAYDAFNPYLPLMSVFGLARATDAPPRLTDARVAFSLITIALVVAALALCRGPTAPRVLTLQAMTVLPTAALPLATGGDDVPIVALMLLGLVLLQRRRPLLAGLALGVGASMKLTAWPLAVVAILAVRGRDGQRTASARWWLAAGILGVVVPSVVPSVVANAPAFVENVVRFPLGLAGVTSPAASPLLGHLLVTAFPQLHRVITVSIVVVGGLAMLFVLFWRTPRSPWEVARLLAWAMAVAIVLAPATRVGYVLYPIDFFVWTWLLRSEEAAECSSRDVVSGAEAVLDDPVPSEATASPGR